MNANIESTVGSIKNKIALNAPRRLDITLIVPERTADGGYPRVATRSSIAPGTMQKPGTIM